MPSSRARMVAAPMTLLMPGAGPPADEDGELVVRTHARTQCNRLQIVKLSGLEPDKKRGKATLLPCPDRVCDFFLALSRYF